MSTTETVQPTLEQRFALSQQALADTRQELKGAEETIEDLNNALSDAETAQRASENENIRLRTQLEERTKQMQAADNRATTAEYALQNQANHRLFSFAGGLAAAIAILFLLSLLSACAGGPQASQSQQLTTEERTLMEVEFLNSRLEQVLRDQNSMSPVEERLLNEMDRWNNWARLELTASRVSHESLQNEVAAKLERANMRAHDLNMAQLRGTSDMTITFDLNAEFTLDGADNNSTQPESLAPSADQMNHTNTRWLGSFSETAWIYGKFENMGVTVLQTPTLDAPGIIRYSSADGYAYYWTWNDPGAVVTDEGTTLVTGFHVVDSANFDPNTGYLTQLTLRYTTP